MINKDRENTPVKFFIYAFSISSIYTFLCFVIVMLTHTDFFLFLPGYAIGVYSIVSPILLFVYGGVYLAYKKYIRATFPLWLIYFNFIYLVLLLCSLVYSLVFYKELWFYTCKDSDYIHKKLKWKVCLQRFFFFRLLFWTYIASFVLSLNFFLKPKKYFF